MGNIQKAWEGAATNTTGVLPLVPQGLPAHMGLQSAVSPVDGSLHSDPRYPAKPHVFVEDTPTRTVDVDIAGTGSVDLQGCNGDPSSAGNWFTIQTVATSTVVYDNTALRFLRISVTSLAGDLRVAISASN